MHITPTTLAGNTLGALILLWLVWFGWTPHPVSLLVAPQVDPLKGSRFFAKTLGVEYACAVTYAVNKSGPLCTTAGQQTDPAVPLSCPSSCQFCEQQLTMAWNSCSLNRQVLAPAAGHSAPCRHWL